MTVRADPFWILTDEHDLLRQAFFRATKAFQGRGDERAARQALRALVASFRIHQQREDRAVYPVCERLFGGREGAVAVLREGHLGIRRELAALTRVRGRERAAFVSALERLRSRTEVHFAQEEQVLFPLLSAFLSGAECVALARRLRSFPEAAESG